MKRWVNSPLILIVSAFALGILIAEYVNIPFLFVYSLSILFLIAAIVALKRNFLFSFLLLISIFFLGFLVCVNFKQQPTHHIGNFASPRQKSVYVIGVITTDPRLTTTSYGEERADFIFEAERLKDGFKWRRVSGKVQVFVHPVRKRVHSKLSNGVHGQSKEISYGDRLLLEGSLVSPSPAGNPGQFDYRDYLKRKGIYVLLTAGRRNIVEILERGQGNPIMQFALGIKRRMEGIIASNIPSPQKELLAAMLLGKREQLPEAQSELFIKTGTFHILAISGLHVGLVLTIFAFGFKLIHIPRKISYSLIIILLFVYALITGARPSVVRATIMAVVFLVGLLLERDVDVGNSIALAGLIILFARPLQLFDAGFQLSFIAVISIVYLTPRIEKLFYRRRENRAFNFPAKVKYYLIKSLCVSISAWLGVAPLIAHYFNIVTPITILANLIVIPLMFIIISIGFCLLAIGGVVEFFASIFGWLSWFSLMGLEKAVSLLSWEGGYFRAASPPLFVILGYYLLLLLCLNYHRLGLCKRKIIIILLLVSNLFIWKGALTPPSGKLSVTFLDVGRGDAMFVEFPCSGTMLIDGGRGGDFDRGRRIIAPYLWNRGIGKIDAVLLTHPHSDHLGGLISVLNNFRIGRIFDNAMEHPSLEYDTYRQTIAARKIPYQVVRKGEMIVGYSGTNVYVLHPPKELLATAEAEINNNSIVLRIEYGDVSFILCGDIEEEGIKELLKYGRNLKSTVIKIPHHGADMGEIGEILLRFVDPEVAVISTSGPSSPRLLADIENVDAQIYSTADYGAISISTDGMSYSVSSFKLLDTK